MAVMNSGALAWYYALRSTRIQLEAHTYSIDHVDCLLAHNWAAEPKEEEELKEEGLHFLVWLPLSSPQQPPPRQSIAGIIEEYLEKSKANKKAPFITNDLEIECEGKDKYRCGSNVFWKW